MSFIQKSVKSGVIITIIIHIRRKGTRIGLLGKSLWSRIRTERYINVLSALGLHKYFLCMYPSCISDMTSRATTFTFRQFNSQTAAHAERGGKVAGDAEFTRHSNLRSRLKN